MSDGRAMTKPADEGGSISFVRVTAARDKLRYIADRWRMDYNHYRPHGSLDYMAPAAFAAMHLEQGSDSLRFTEDRMSNCERRS